MLALAKERARAKPVGNTESLRPNVFHLAIASNVSATLKTQKVSDTAVHILKCSPTLPKTPARV